MIIDTHVHIYPPEIIQNAQNIAKKEPYFAALTAGKVHRWATADDLIERMDKDGIAQSWVFGFAFNDMGLCKLCNDYVLSSCNIYNDRLKAMAVVNPLHKGLHNEIYRMRTGGAIGVGELFPQGQNFDTDDIRQTWRLAQACYDAGMFLCLHTGENVGHDYPGKASSRLKAAADFCKHHPEVNVILAHMGGGLFLYETMKELRLELKNAYYDTAAVPFLYDDKIIDCAFAAGCGDKILYGSDYPILSYERYQNMLTPEIQGQFYANTKKLLEKTKLPSGSLLV